MKTPHQVAIIIPIYKKFEDNTVFDLTSLKQALKVFSNRPIYFIGPKSLNINGYKAFAIEWNILFNFISFGDQFFSDVNSYSKLCMSKVFYNQFIKYQYILLYQTDAFVFADELDKWCNKGYDYIGAPWFDGLDNANEDSVIIGVGNGGFSLRRVSSFLKVLNILRLLKSPNFNVSGLKTLLKNPGLFIKLLKHELLVKKNNYVSMLPARFPYYEDIFWGKYVHQFFPWFKVSSVQDAISFAFEVNPELLYKLNGNCLPMGVHAWEKYDIDFWRPFIEKEGYKIE